MWAGPSFGEAHDQLLLLLGNAASRRQHSVGELPKRLQRTYGDLHDSSFPRRGRVGCPWRQAHGLFGDYPERRALRTSPCLCNVLITTPDLGVTRSAYWALGPLGDWASAPEVTTSDRRRAQSHGGHGDRSIAAPWIASQRSILSQLKTATVTTSARKTTCTARKNREG